MVGKITHIGTIESLTNYNFKKIEEGVAEKLFSQGIIDETKHSVNLSFKAVSALDETVADPYVHFILNFAIEDTPLLSNEKMEEITKEALGLLGYRDQPQFAIRHYDQDHPHVHVITHSLKENGTKVSRNWERYRLQDINRHLEKKHGLREISSVKSEKSKNIDTELNLDRSADYKNYLTQSVKEAMNFKPRRIEYFKEILLYKYNISASVIEKKDFKGFSFAVTDEVGGRYIEEKGTLGIGGSDLSKNFSFPKIKKQVDYNFMNSRKEYRKLLSFENFINNELKHFEAINVKDFNKYFKDAELYSTKEGKIIFLDKRSKNIYDERDLKNIDLSKVTLEKTSFSFKEEHKKNIVLQAVNSYKQSLKFQGFTSEFVKYVADKNNIKEFVENTNIYKKFEPILEDKNIQELESYISGLSMDRLFEEIQEKEILQRELDISTYENFPGQKLISSGDIFKKNNPISFEYQHLLKGMRNISEKVLELGEKDLPYQEKTPKLPSFQTTVDKNFFILHEKYFSKESLQGEYLKQYEKLVSNHFVGEVKNEAFRKEIEPEKAIKYLNDRGIEVFKEGEDLHAKIKGFEESFKLNSIERDFLLGGKDIDQKVETNKEIIDLRLAIDDQNWYKVSQSLELLSPKDKKVLEKNEVWKQWNNSREESKLFNEKLYELRREMELGYKSDLAHYAKDHPKEFSQALEEKTKGDIRGEKMEEFIKEFSSADTIKKLEHQEKKMINENIHQALVFAEPSKMLALAGYRNEGGGITEKTGKYIVKNVNVSADNRIEKEVQIDKAFKIYSPLIRDMIHEVSTKEEGQISNPMKLSILEVVKEHMNPIDFEKIKEVAEKNYINYFVDKAMNSEEIPNKMEYLNSKGIELEAGENGTKLSVIGSNSIVEKEVKIGIDLSLQQDILQHVGKGDGKKSNFTIRTSANIENENFKSVAYDLKKEGKNPKDIFLTSIDSKGKEKIANEFKAIPQNRSEQSILSELFKGQNAPNKKTKISKGNKKKKKGGRNG
ncbi:relaxase/mobilization nuclease domain-containing protein [Elizabethkingia ursingii]